MAELTITLRIVGGEPTAVISDTAGNEKTVRGVVLFGLDGAGADLYTFCWGKPTDAAAAVGEGIARATAAGDGWYDTFYRALLAQMMMRTQTRPDRQEVTPEEVEERWVPEGVEPKRWN